MPTEEIEEAITTEIEVEEVFKVMNYPNPFTEYTTITFPEATAQMEVTLTNLSGQTAYQDKLKTLGNQKSIRLELYNLPSGYYMYTLTDIQNGKTYQGKVLKQ